MAQIRISNLSEGVSLNNHRIYRPSVSDFTDAELDGKSASILKKGTFDQFTPALLGLGDIASEANSIDAIAAVFDLEGFTRFCGQIEPQLSVPRFLSEFMNWLMGQLKEESVHKRHELGVLLYSPLPFFVKFMGDGLLVLWDASQMADARKRIVMMNCRGICLNYKSTFYQRISKSVVDPPPVLRCGLARGTVYSVGNGTDFVGSCINMAARLQKIPGVTFAMNIRGITLDVSDDSHYRKYYVIKRVSIRGIGDNELVAFWKDEIDVMKARDKRRIRDL